MDSASVSVDELGSSLSAFLSGYVKELEDQAKEDVDAAARATEEELHEWKGRTGRSTGKYAKGWTTSEDREVGAGYAVRVHNKSKPGLAHLLSKGHALRNGGFYGGDGHVASAADTGIAELERRIANG